MTGTFKESQCSWHSDVFVVWESGAWSLDPHKRFVWRSDAWRRKAAGRIASRSDLLVRVHLGEVEAGTSIEEDWGPWENEVWGSYGPSGVFVLLLPLSSSMIWIPCASLWTTHTWPGHLQSVPVDGKSYFCFLGILRVGVFSVYYFCLSWWSAQRVRSYNS